MAGFENIGFCGVDCRACADFTEKKCGGCRPTVKGSNEDCFFVKRCRKHGVPHCGKYAVFLAATLRNLQKKVTATKRHFSDFKTFNIP